MKIIYGLVAALGIAGIAGSANAEGFYAGLSLGKFDSKSVGTTGDGSVAGALFGYRFATNENVFVYAEGQIGKADGTGDNGNTTFGNNGLVKFGVGTTLDSNFTLAGHVGYLEQKWTHTNLGSQTDKGEVVGVMVGYGVGESTEVGLEYNRSFTSNGTNKSYGNWISLRLTQHF